METAADAVLDGRQVIPSIATEGKGEYVEVAEEAEPATAEPATAEPATAEPEAEAVVTETPGDDATKAEDTNE